MFLTDGEPTNIVGDTEAAQHTGDAGNSVAYDAAKDDVYNTDLEIEVGRTY